MAVLITTSSTPSPGTRRISRTAPDGLTAWARLGMLVLLALVVVGCVDEDQEQQLGDAIAADVNARIPLVTDAFTNAYVDRVGQHIADHSERPHVPFRFYIVNSSMVNAFALPGGHVYVTRGLIQRTENLSEFAAVLAHEIGHVAARHGAKALQRELRTGSVVSMLYEVFLGREPPLLEHRALNVGSRVWFASHSRRAEREADRLALAYLVRSGVDPEGMLTVLAGLLEEEAELQRPPVEWFSTHPATADRLQRLQRKVAELEPTPPDLTEDIASYPMFLQRLAMLPPPPAG